jgi:hypothetical protein
MRILLAAVASLAASLALSGAARADDLHMATLAPVEDVSIPYWCNWGYDWDERCYRDDSDRLGVGGVDDKVWRGALRFSLDRLPPSAVVVTAELSLWYDRTCVAPLRRRRACDGRGFELDAHPIYTARWSAERELEFGPTVAVASLEPLADPGWVVWDLTDLVAEWQSHDLPNDGVLLALGEDEEAFDASGPSFPSSTYSNAPLRPALTVWYLTG